MQEQIESIRSQTFTDWRLIVSDDCSIDSTLAIVENEAAKDSRIQVVSKEIPFGSAKSNFIHLLSFVDAPYVMFCDQDDYWLSNKIERQIIEMIDLEKTEGDGTPLAVFSDSIVTDSTLNIVNGSFLSMNTVTPFQVSLENQLVENAIPGNCLLVNKALAEIASLLSDCEHIIMHDWAVIIVALACGKVRGIEEGLLLYRQHSNNAAGVADRNKISFLLGKIKDNPQRSFRATADQARVIVNQIGGAFPAKSLELVSAWGDVYSHRRSERLKICKQYGFWKKGCAKKIYQIMFI